MASDRRPIMALDKKVVDRIAAGEVIERPANALKELLENALDAGSTTIAVVVKGGGLKLLQITDNGHGIHKDDFPLVCQRFATSKLATFDDLKSIGTFGFRGEALASISHVAHVTITSKTGAEPCAFVGKFADGELTEKIKPQAGNTGTTIKVEDLFYNVKTRRKALKSASEEFNRVLDVLTRYALRNAGVAFSLKKYGDNRAALNTQVGSTVKGNIALLYGSDVARELLDIDLSLDTYNASVKGHISNANYASKKDVSVLFVNSRSVSVPSIHKAIKAVYSEYLPKKTSPFVYLDISLPPHTVDVNVHPTKKQVHFMHEDEIAAAVADAVREALLNANASRTFYAQAVLPTFSQAQAQAQAQAAQASSSSVAAALKPVESAPVASTRPAKVAQQHKVRHDPSSQSLEAFVRPVAAASRAGARSTTRSARRSRDESSSQGSQAGLLRPNIMFASPERSQDSSASQPSQDSQPAAPARNARADSRTGNTATKPKAGGSTRSTRKRSPPPSTDPDPRPSKRKASLARNTRRPVQAAAAAAADPRTLTPPTNVALTSVNSLCETVMANEHPGLSAVFQRHSFVGLVNASYALIQHETKLYLLDVPRVSRALFYQLGLRGFSAFPRFVFSSRPKVADLIAIALDDPASNWSPDDGPKDVLAKATSEFLLSKSEMLEEYFGLVLDPESGALVALPQLLPSYFPCLWALPRFLLNLGSTVDWTVELACFHSFLDALAVFYAVHPEQRLDEGVEPAGDATLAWTIEHVLFPALRSHFHPPSEFATNGTVLQVAALENLYKIFERC